MQERNAFYRAVLTIDQGLKWLEIVLVAGSTLTMAIVLAGNFISRNLLGASWLFAEEVGSFMLIVQCFAGMAYCSRYGRHIRMSALFDLLPPKYRRAVMILICVVTAVFLAYLGYLGVIWVMRTYASGKVSSVLRLPLWIVYLVIPFGCFMSVFQYFITGIKNVRDRENIWIGTFATDADVE